MWQVALCGCDLYSGKSGTCQTASSSALVPLSLNKPTVGVFLEANVLSSSVISQYMESTAIGHWCEMYMGHSSYCITITNVWPNWRVCDLIFWRDWAYFLVKQKTKQCHLSCILQILSSPPYTRIYMYMYIAYTCIYQATHIQNQCT